MVNNNQKYENNNNVNNVLYKENRNSIIQLIKKINKALDNSSQTFFLALYYIDLILTNEKFEKNFKYYYENNENDLEINENDLVMISLSCLIVSTKFNENDPNVPNIISFINFCAYYSYNRYIYKVEELKKAEVIVIKLLEYKLNYYTLYHFFSFFFTHGFLFEKIFEKEDIKLMKLSKNEMLEKIYILSREIMDEFIEDYENIKFILGNDILFTSIEILISATQHILNNSLLELFDEKKNIFELLYQINCDQNKENNEIIKNKLKIIYDIQKAKKDKEAVKEIKTINKITQVNEENKIMNESNSKINEEDINYKNNNLLISWDTNYLEKYKYTNASKNKISNNEKANPKKKSNEKYSNIQFYITKYKFFGKNTKDAKGVSRSINNFKYKKLFQFNNNINFKENNRYNYSSSKKENKENIVFNDNIRTSLDKYLKTNTSNNTNNLNDKFNNIYLNYRYDNNNVNNNNFNDTNDIKLANKISCIKNNIHQNYNEYKTKINENNRDMVYKTKLILDKFSYPSINIIKNMKNSEYFNNNQQSNFYHSKLFDDIINNKMDNRYSKENIQDNFSESININSFNTRSLDFIKDKNFLNEYNLSMYKINYHKNNDIKLCKKEENKTNNNFSGTFYQYGKLNQYENIDKFCNNFTNVKYIPYYQKNRNKYYY